MRDYDFLRDPDWWKGQQESDQPEHMGMTFTWGTPPPPSGIYRPCDSGTDGTVSFEDA